MEILNLSQSYKLTGLKLTIKGITSLAGSYVVGQSKKICLILVLAREGLRFEACDIIII
jgi:hypothetical protein